MKILLIYPEFPETYWSFSHALSFEGKRSALLPDTWERIIAETPEPRRDGWMSDLKALFRVVLTLGIRDSARGEFWRYLGITLRRHRNNFASAIRLAAMGYHFRKLTEFSGESLNASSRTMES